METEHLIKVGIENNFEGRSLAWVLDYPGCFCYGSGETEALVRVPQALLAYQSWLAGYDARWLEDLGDFDVRLVEVTSTRYLNEQYEPADSGMEVNAWFYHDWLPLSEPEITRGLNVLTWAHQDLFELTASLCAASLDQSFPQERWTIRGILNHVYNSESYYLNRLDLLDLPANNSTTDVWKCLQNSLELNQHLMPQLVNCEIVRGKEGEFWSARKVLRRTCWHALDHAQHIHRLITTQLNP